MILESLYSPTGALLQHINFKNGLNLIIGRKGEAIQDKRHSLNGIGKSSLVRLLDYMLLGTGAADYFKKKKFDFLRKERHEVCLHLILDKRKLILRRSFADDRIIVEEKLDNDIKTIFQGRSKEAKGFFADWFFPQNGERGYPGNSFRSLMSFFIKDDLDNHARKRPEELLTHKGATKADNVLLNFYLMGLSNFDLTDFVKLADTRKLLLEQKNKITAFLQENGSGSPAQLRSKVASQEEILVVQQRALGKFQLSPVWQQIAVRLDELNNILSELQVKIQQVTRSLNKLRQFTRVHAVDIDVHEIARRYEYSAAWLSERIRKTLEETLAFRRSLADERFRFYRQQIETLEAQYRALTNESRELDEERAALLRTVDGDMNASLSQAWQNIARNQVELESLKARLVEFEQVEQQLLDNEQALLDAKKAVGQSLMADKEKIQHIVSLFQAILREAYQGMQQLDEKDAFLSIDRVNKGSSALPADIKLVLPAEEALGKYRQKMVLYDLCLFFNMIDKQLPLPRFLVHDGIFHGMENRIKVNLLNYIYQRSQKDSFQYIATFNREEISLLDDGDRREAIYNFDLAENTILNLEDHPESMLFRRVF